MAPLANFYERISGYWLSEPGIGKRSRLGTIAYWLALGPVWSVLRRCWISCLRLDSPSWVHEPQFKPERLIFRSTWHSFVNPVSWLLWVINFLYEWIVSRPYLSFGPAVPAIVAGLAMILIVYRSSFTEERWREDFYRQTLSRAARDEDDALTRLALENLIEFDPEHVELQLRCALLDEKLGKEQEAIEAMAALASRKNSIAAFWLVRKLFPLQGIEVWPKEKHEQFQSLMAVALADGPKNGNFVGARILMAQYLVAVGAASDAISTLESVAYDAKDLMLVTATLHSQLYNHERAKVWAERAEHFYRDKLLSSPADTGIRLNLAKALLIQGREEDVAKTLSDGFKLTQDQQLLAAGGESLANWANRIQASEPSDEKSMLKRLQLLTRAVELAPQNHIVLESLISTALQCADSDNTQITSLRQRLLSKLDAEKLHFIEGTVELLKGNVAKADALLQLAASNASNVPGVLNNLAVVMHQRENPDLEKALTLANAALKAAPNHPYLRETRGQILLKMKNYNQAILDLEFALTAKELHVPVHTSLAEAYQGIGLQEIAASHQRLAEQGPDDVLN